MDLLLQKLLAILYCALQRLSEWPHLQVASMLLFLHKLREVFKHYFEELEEESLRDNFVIAYELLDEVCWAFYGSEVCLSSAVNMQVACLHGLGKACSRAQHLLVTPSLTGCRSKLSICCHSLAIVHCSGGAGQRVSLMHPFYCWQDVHASPAQKIMCQALRSGQPLHPP